MTEPLSASEASEPNELSLLDLLVVVAKRKKLILGLPFIVAILTAAYSLTLDNYYASTTRLLPPQQKQTAGMLAQLGDVASLVTGVAGVRGPNELYVGMLKSRTVADNLVQRFDLMKRYKIDPEFPSDAHKTLAKLTMIASGKDGIITLEVEDKDPLFASNLANAYVEEFLKLTQTLAVTEASQRRLFFERQLTQAKDNLAKAESDARQALQTNGLVKVDDQGRAMVEVTARLRGQITVKEVQIGAMSTYAADRNPDLMAARQELAAIKRELAKIEGTGTPLPLNAAPAGKNMDSLNYLRNVKYYEVMYEFLAKQYEAARIDEAKDSAVVQVLDKAVPSDRKSRPRRSLIVLFSALAAGFMALLWAFAREAAARARENPEQSRRLQAFRGYLAAKW